MKDTALDQVDDGQKKSSLQKLNLNIERIESIIKELLDGVDIKELNSEKRLKIGARYFALHQRAIELRHAFELDHAGNAEDWQMTNLMSFMRGELKLDVAEAVSVVDALGDAGPITPYREVPGLE